MPGRKPLFESELPSVYAALQHANPRDRALVVLVHRHHTCGFEAKLWLTAS
jgi:hypothetical protein